MQRGASRGRCAPPRTRQGRPRQYVSEGRRDSQHHVASARGGTRDANSRMRRRPGDGAPRAQRQRSHWFHMARVGQVVNSLTPRRLRETRGPRADAGPVSQAAARPAPSAGGRARPAVPASAASCVASVAARRLYRSQILQVNTRWNSYLFEKKIEKRDMGRD